jgi:hypothetical protein
MTPLVKAWLRSTRTSSFGARETVESVMERVPSVKQRRRGRWLAPLPWQPSTTHPTTTSSGHAPAGGFLMYALKYVVAGVIVALFGGFLLAGVLTTPVAEEAPPAAATESPAAVAESPSPITEPPGLTATTELLSGFETTEVEPGVFRIDDDGYHDMALRPRKYGGPGPVFGHDGSIWYDLGNRLFQLGEDRTITIPEKRRFGGRHTEVSADGTVWTIESGGAPTRKEIGGVIALRSFDGERWTLHKKDPVDVDIAPDGTVWAAWVGQGKNTVVGSYEDGDWERLPGFVRYADDLYISHEGELWLSKYGYGSFPKDMPHGDTELYRHVEGDWERVLGPDTEVRGDFAFGADGVLRVDTPDGRHLYFEDGGWRKWQTPSWQPAWEEGWPSWHVFADGGYPHAPDGSLWATWKLPPPEECSWLCFDRVDGVVRFDGDTFQHFLPGYQLQLWGFTSDGAAWFTGGDAEWTLPDGSTEDDRPIHTYVIVPDSAG